MKLYLDTCSIHVAENANVDYFCTCDDKFLRRAKAISSIRIRVMSPLELIEVLEL